LREKSVYPATIVVPAHVRMVVELFRNEQICESLIFCGGTAFHKLFFPEPLRFSEDIDLVQREPGPIGPLFDMIRGNLSGMGG